MTAEHGEIAKGVDREDVILAELSTRSWWAMVKEQQERRYAEESAKWFDSVKEGDVVPDLDFDTPLCSICTRSTCFEDGQFYCETCNVWWPQSGYGSEAQRFDVNGNIVPLTGSNAQED